MELPGRHFQIQRRMRRRNGVHQCRRAAPWIDIRPDEVGQCQTGREQPLVVCGWSRSRFGAQRLIPVEKTQEPAIRIHHLVREGHEQPKLLRRGLHHTDVFGDTAFQVPLGGTCPLELIGGYAAAGELVFQQHAQAAGQLAAQRPGGLQYLPEKRLPARIGKGREVPVRRGQQKADFWRVDAQQSNAQIAGGADVDGVPIMNRLFDVSRRTGRHAECGESDGHVTIIEPHGTNGAGHDGISGVSDASHVAAAGRPHATRIGRNADDVQPVLR